MTGTCARPPSPSRSTRTPSTTSRAPTRSRSAPARSATSWATRSSSCSGVDRLDYTKGIRHRIKAYGELLERGAAVAAEHHARPGGQPEPRERGRLPAAARRRGAPGRPHQRRLRPGGPRARAVPAPVVPDGGDGRPVPRGRRHAGHRTARRHEPRGQGVRRRPVRRPRAPWSCRSSRAPPTS